MILWLVDYNRQMSLYIKTKKILNQKVYSIQIHAETLNQTRKQMKKNYYISSLTAAAGEWRQTSARSAPSDGRSFPGWARQPCRTFLDLSHIT